MQSAYDRCPSGGHVITPSRVASHLGRRYDLPAVNHASPPLPPPLPVRRFVAALQESAE